MTARFRASWLEAHRVDVSTLRRSDIIGIGHVMAEVDALAARLRDPALAAAMGLEEPRGVLLWGDPGLGKTLVARHIAGTLGPDVPFFEVSADELSPERIRGALRYLATTYPRSVLYLDEVDTFGMARDYAGHDPDTRLLLTATLAALDGLIATPGPVVIASSNRAPAFLDPALVRAGRLGIRIRFDAPNEAERAELLALFARSVPLEDDIDWMHAARLSRGMSPATLAQVIATAAGLALADSRMKLANADVSTSIARDGGGRVEPDQVLAGPERIRLANHESGHVAAAVALRGAGWVYSVRIGPLGGHTNIGDEDGSDRIRPDDEMTDALVVAFGGIAGELALGMGSDGGRSDVSAATAIALGRMTSGATADPAPLDLDHLGVNVAESVKQALAEGLVDQITVARQRAIEIVYANLGACRRFAERLSEAGELVGTELAQAIADAGFRPEADGAE